MQNLVTRSNQSDNRFTLRLIPLGTTPIKQPLDLCTFHQIKDFVKVFNNLVIIYDVNIQARAQTRECDQGDFSHLQSVLLTEISRRGPLFVAQGGIYQRASRAVRTAVQVCFNRKFA